MNRPPLPPFNLDSAIQKVRMAEDAWNTRDRVALAYTMDSRWRNRTEFLQGPTQSPLERRRSGVIKSMGSGNTTVELFSVEMSASVCR